MKKAAYLVAILSAALMAPAGFLISRAESLAEQVRERLRGRLEAAPRHTVGREQINSFRMLPLFYERRIYEPAWLDDRGPQPVAEALVRALRGAAGHGLQPQDYHLALIKEMLTDVQNKARRGTALDPRVLVDLELLLTDAFLIYGAHLLAGRVDPEKVHPLWIASRRDADMAAVLQRALDANRIEAALEELAPPQAGYARLRRELTRHRGLAASGGWPAVPEGSVLEVDVRDERVRTLRARLRASGELKAALGAEDDLFDEVVEAAVRRFQARHGLAEDGKLGPETLRALNVPVEQRIHQIELSLERWRWLPQELGTRHILVNIPSFELKVVEDDRAVMNMRAIVGKHFRRTPVFSGQMTYLVLSPLWHVPNLIAVADLLPRQKGDANYFRANGFRVFTGWGAETREINPADVDWSLLGPAKFPYRLRQDPGPKNFLGGVKFMYPNKFNVYLHDTPDRELFARPERGFSSGCIRLEKPVELASYVLRSDARWTPSAIRTAMDRRTEQTVRLSEPIAVHLLYWTAWVTEDGGVHFRRDVYERDKQLDAALHQPPPAPSGRARRRGRPARAERNAHSVCKFPEREAGVPGAASLSPITSASM